MKDCHTLQDVIKGKVKVGVEGDSGQDIIRAKQFGLSPDLPDGMKNLVENPKKFMEAYIESILSKKGKDNEIVSKQQEDEEEKEINPIIKRQLFSLKNSMKSNKLSIDDVVKHLKDEDE